MEYYYIKLVLPKARYVILESMTPSSLCKEIPNPPPHFHALIMQYSAMQCNSAHSSAMQYSDIHGM